MLQRQTGENFRRHNIFKTEKYWVRKKVMKECYAWLSQSFNDKTPLV